MSGKKTKRMRREVKKVVGKQYFELYNSMCSQPFSRRVVTAYRIFVGRKLRVKR